MLTGVNAAVMFCFKKVGHHTKKEAKQAAFKMMKKNKTRYNTYRCRICGKWHIGMSNKWGRQI